MDCIILAGSDADSYRKVANEENKAFLPVGGKPIIQTMLERLQRVKQIDRILLVGPSERFEALLRDMLPGYTKPILVFEQQRNLVANVMSVFEATGEGLPADRHVLIMSSDVPFLTEVEVAQFIERSNMDRYDYIAGMVTDETLSRFYPRDGKPGIVMGYFYVDQGNFRVNNMHMVRPSAFPDKSHIQNTYEMRYQKKWYNVLKMAARIIPVSFKAPTGIYYYLVLQVVRILNLWGLHGLRDRAKKWAPLATIERLVSQILGVRFKVVVTDYGSTAIDVDNDEDYQAILSRHEDWSQMLGVLQQKASV